LYQAVSAIVPEGTLETLYPLVIDIALALPEALTARAVEVASNTAAIVFIRSFLFS
jgi:hypothetical protein